MLKHLYIVHFEGSFVGYCWALGEREAVQQVVGECACDENGAPDYRYTATR